MTIKFAETMKATQGGLEKVPATKGAHLVEDWETALADTDVVGSKGIMKDLESLKKQLERSEPDADRIGTLLHRLGESTTKIAERADKSGDKLKELGAALTKAGHA